MQDAYYTDTGERPELAAIEVNPPEGYIGARLMPVVSVADKSGTAYYLSRVADSDADPGARGQTGRSAGSAPTATQISDSSTTFTTAEVVQRAAITPDEAKQMGGISNADMIGTRWSKREVMARIEDDVSALTLDATNADSNGQAFNATNFPEQIQTALDNIRDYPGRRILFGGTMVLKTLIRLILDNNAWGPALQRLVSGSSPGIAASGLSFALWRSALATWLGVDEVLAGDSTIWDRAGHASENKIGIMPEVDPDPLSHKWQPVYGKTFLFMPDGSQPFVIQSVADRVNVNNLYDCYAWFDTIEFNGGTGTNAAIQVIDGIA